MDAAAQAAAAAVAATVANPAAATGAATTEVKTPVVTTPANGASTTTPSQAGGRMSFAERLASRAAASKAAATPATPAVTTPAVIIPAGTAVTTPAVTTPAVTTPAVTNPAAAKETAPLSHFSEDGITKIPVIDEETGVMAEFYKLSAYDVGNTSSSVLEGMKGVQKIAIEAIGYTEELEDELEMADTFTKDLMKEHEEMLAFNEAALKMANEKFFLHRAAEFAKKNPGKQMKTPTDVNVAMDLLIRENEALRGAINGINQAETKKNTAGQMSREWRDTIEGNSRGAGRQQPPQKSQQRENPNVHERVQGGGVQGGKKDMSDALKERLKSVAGFNTFRDNRGSPIHSGGDVRTGYSAGGVELDGDDNDPFSRAAEYLSGRPSAMSRGSFQVGFNDKVDDRYLDPRTMRGT